MALALAGSLGLTCRRAPPAAPVAAPARTSPAPSALVLPDLAGFQAAAPADGPSYVRRTYSRGRARIEVTLARLPMSPDAWAEWLANSADFPQASLAVPSSDANGFYQCSAGPPPSCDLLIQLRAGYHLEIRGGGTSTRDDVDALARALPLRALAQD